MQPSNGRGRELTTAIRHDLVVEAGQCQDNTGTVTADREQELYASSGAVVAKAGLRLALRPVQPGSGALNLGFAVRTMATRAPSPYPAASGKGECSE